MKQERALNHRTPGDGTCRDHNTENEAKMGKGLKSGMTVQHIYVSSQQRSHCPPCSVLVLTGLIRS